MGGEGNGENGMANATWLRNAWESVQSGDRGGGGQCVMRPILYYN